MLLITRWFLNALTLVAIAAVLPGVSVSGFYAALIAVIILSLVNAIIRPLLILLTLPITIITLGLFTLVINAGLFWFVSTFIKGFEVVGFVDAFLGALLLSLASWAFSSLLRKE